MGNQKSIFDSDALKGTIMDPGAFDSGQPAPRRRRIYVPKRRRSQMRTAPSSAKYVPIWKLLPKRETAKQKYERLEKGHRKALEEQQYRNKIKAFQVARRARQEAIMRERINRARVAGTKGRNIIARTIRKIQGKKSIYD